VFFHAKITISMDGVGRAMDNVFIERLWLTIKYDRIYPSPADSGNALRDGLEVFIDYFNEDWPHSVLGDATPDKVYNSSSLQQRAA
jgi:putative transposase